MLHRFTRISTRTFNTTARVKSSTKMPRPPAEPRRFVTSPHGISAYPPWRGPSQAPGPLVTPRPFLSFLPHPEKTAPPQPPRPELAPSPEGWTRSYHASPAAYPKELKQAHGKLGRASHPFRSGPAPAKESKEERTARNAAEVKELIKQRFDAEEWTVSDAMDSPVPGLWVAAERWRRDKPVGGYTLVCTHANGLQKEHWHTALRDLLTRDPTKSTEFGTGNPLGVPTDIQIDDIWMFDDCNHGASIDLNEGKIGPTQSWVDVGRDVLNFVQHVLPGVKAAEAAGGKAADWQLKWNSDTLNAPVKVLGLGHSFGGNGLLQAAHARPDLFHGLCLIDPMMPPHVGKRDNSGDPRITQLPAGALKRRNGWPSRQAAAEAFGAQPFFAAWHPNALKTYVSHGLVPVDYAKPDGPVVLATPPWSEAAVFLEPTGVARGWDKLPYLPIPIGFIQAGDPTASLGENTTQEMVWRAPLSRNERVMDAGHLVLQEDPKAAADAIWRFLGTLQAGKWVEGKAKL